MDKLKYIKLENEDGSYSSSIPLAVDSEYVDVNGNTLTNELNNKANIANINNLQSQINGLASGSPLAASSISGMTDITRIYVNTTDGHWYWYNGTTWTDGGVYEATSNQGQVDFLSEQVGTKYTNFGTTSTSATVKNIMMNPVITKAGDTIEFNLLTTVPQKITKFAATGWTSGGQYKQFRTENLPNQKYIITVPNTYSDYNRLQMYINTTDTIADTDITPYVIVNGSMTSQVLDNKNDIENNSNNIEILSGNVNDIVNKLPYGNLIHYTENTTFEPGSIMKNDGSVQGANYHSDYIPVKPNTKYYQYGGYLENWYACYDKNKNFVSGLEITKTGGTGGSQYGYFTTPANAYYYRYTLTDTSASKIVNYYISETANQYLPKDFDFSDLVPRISKQIESIGVDDLYNSKILVLGDSISTDYYGNYKKWVTDLIDEGTFDSAKVINNSIHATGFVATYNNQANSFNDRIQEVTDKSSYDIVITFGGINDYNQNVPWNDFTAAVDTYLEYLVKNFTQARLVILSPLRTFATWTNTQGKYVTDYCDYIKQKAKYYSLPILNLTDESGFCPYINEFRNMWTLQPEGYESHDGVHPNQEYEKKYLAPMIKNFLKGLIKKNN